MIPVFMVTVGTASEEPCVFPFHYKGNTYSDCTIKDESALWCATTQNYARRKWRYCEDVPRWSVTYSHTHICALEGSSVTMSCFYTYPSYLTVKEVFWTNQDTTQGFILIYQQMSFTSKGSQ
ncbi:epididymal sperm-binding protein 1-like [Sardina pilchardus]|uniref:epididymal sperm-binding protein 1-like n=1 Tax=Sardina pilchardus TaxID=27697 RepID=UPI002E101467